MDIPNPLQIKRLERAISDLENAKYKPTENEKKITLIVETNLIRQRDNAILQGTEPAEVLRQAKITLASCQTRVVDGKPVSYHGVLSNQDAEKKLQGSDKGTWLLYFNNLFGVYVVGYVDDDNTIKHM